MVWAFAILVGRVAYPPCMGEMTRYSSTTGSKCVTCSDLPGPVGLVMSPLAAMILSNSSLAFSTEGGSETSHSMTVCPVASGLTIRPILLPPCQDPGGSGGFDTHDTTAVSPGAIHTRFRPECPGNLTDCRPHHSRGGRNGEGSQGWSPEGIHQQGPMADVLRVEEASEMGTRGGAQD